MDPPALDDPTPVNPPALDDAVVVAVAAAADAAVDAADAADAAAVDAADAAADTDPSKGAANELFIKSAILKATEAVSTPDRNCCVLDKPLVFLAFFICVWV